MTSTLPGFLRDLLASCPNASAGVHRWLYSVARQMHAHYSDKAEMARVLEAACRGCGRHVSRKEIEDAITNSERVAWYPGGGLPRRASGLLGNNQSGAGCCPAPKWPTVRQELRERAIKAGGGLANLRELSRLHIEDNEQHTEEIIHRLFPGNPLLCCGRSQSNFDTRRREAWNARLTKLQFIVPSPMSAVEGVTKGGKPSRHTLSNTGPRRFLVVEFDSGGIDDHAAILIHLAGYAPLVCAVHSGGKSLHGWFFVAGQPEEELIRFFRYAVSLGADPATWTRSQFVRMPDGTRDNGQRQMVFFLSFIPLEAAQ